MLVVLLAVPSVRKILSQDHMPKLNFRLSYLIVAFFSFLIVSLLPSVAIFKGAFRIHVDGLTKIRQSTVVTDLEKSEQTLLDDMKRLVERSEDDNVTRSEAFIENAIFPGLYPHQGDEVCLCRDGKIVCSPATNQNGSHNENTVSPEKNWPFFKQIIEWLLDWHPFKRATEQLPVYNELAGKFRYSLSDQIDDGRSKWEYLKPNNTIQFSRFGHGGNIQYRMKSPLPLFFPLGGWITYLIFYVGFSVFLFVLWKGVRGLSNRIVGLELSDFEVWEKLDDNQKHQILVRPSVLLVSELEEYAVQCKFKIIDLSDPTPDLLQTLNQWAINPPRRTGLLVKNFESVILDPQLRPALLRLLEGESTYDEKTPETDIILCSSISPLSRLARLGAYPESGTGAQGESPEADETFRWSALLSNFQIERFPYKVPDWRQESTPFEATLSHECRWTESEELESIYDSLLPIVESKGKANSGDQVEKQIIKQVGDRAEAFYRRLWMLCSKEERLVLLHLAQGNMVNPQHVDVVERLMQRNLIRRDPDFRLPSWSFTHFVLTAEPPERIAEWEAEEAMSRWTILRAPFFFLLVLVAVFIWLVGGEALNTTIILVTAGLSALPALASALNAFRTAQLSKQAKE